MRQIVLDTETTGLEPKEGHRLIEIGCVELIDRKLTGNNFHQYLQPDREVPLGAINVHGITNEFLVDKPRFSDVVADFIDYVRGAELIIHNAPFDKGFINHELRLHDKEAPLLESFTQITDSLAEARQRHPGQRNTLDALCKRYKIDSSERQLHGALLDAELLADVYLAMTGGQIALNLESHQPGSERHHGIQRLSASRPPLMLVEPTADELIAHQEQLVKIDKASGGGCLWLVLSK
ncbi:MAG: DNA polymerase III subunit epsilon [Gammaproteobacteria bacterium]|nr:DNA polymerase III subunit epsilon [Gammaproteobacteria bacterium]